MSSLVRTFDSVRFDPSAFRRNRDGTWCVLTDTTIYSGTEDLEHTLLLPSGAQVEARMFWADGIDLFDILESTRRGTRRGALPAADLLDVSTGRRARPTVDRL